MDITKARKVVELIKDNKKILVTLWEEDRISCCVEEANTQRCETCQGDAELCSDYIEHLKERGFEAREIALTELGIEESLPRFLEEREVRAEEPKIEGEAAEQGEEPYA